MAPETDEDVVLGVLRITVGGIVKTMPTLKVKYVDAWMRSLSPVVGAARAIGEWTDVQVAELPGQNAALMIEWIIGYDRTGALGGREWLEENADPGELHAALTQMLGNANPLADARAQLGLLLLRRATAGSSPPSSTNGASTNGAKAPTRSEPVSTRSS
jgi:hypothetical protein